MKNTFLILILCFSASRIFAQSDLLIYEYQNISGRNYLSNGIIQAKEYVFDGRIDQSFIDSTKETLTLLIRGESNDPKWSNNFGKLLLFDLKSGKIKWEENIKNEYSKFLQSDDYIVETSELLSNIIIPETGDVQSQVNTTIYYIDSINKTGIGYKVNTRGQYGNDLEAINLKDGALLWERRITHKYGWNDISHLNDSVLLLLSDGLHTFNIKNGKGWDYKTVTGKFDLISEFEYVVGIASNAVIDSSAIYFASGENIVRLNTDGKIIWEAPLEKNKVSNSSVFINDSLLYMINKGYAFNENGHINYGTPYFAAFNKHTGKQVFFTSLMEEKSLIKSFIIQNNTAILILKDRILKYSLVNGEKIAGQPFEIDTTGELTDFAGKQFYCLSDSVLYNLKASDSTSLYLKTDKNKILVLNKQLGIIKQIDPKAIFICYLQTDDYKFLAKGYQSVVIDKDNKIVADFKVSQYARLIGKKLYDLQSRSLIEIDLEVFLGKKTEVAKQ